MAVDQALDELLAEAEGPRPSRAFIERLLTAGYAEALELEAQRVRIADRIEKLLPSLSPEDPRVTELSAQLSAVSARLRTLRRRLATVRVRFATR
jgi:hypothetical protein